jgi:hypothetical protein
MTPNLSTPAAGTDSRTGWTLVAAALVLAALSRLLPHPPNFTPLEAMGLFAGAVLLDRRLAFLLPLGAMAISDAGLALLHGMDYGFHSGLPLIYALLAFNVLLGIKLLPQAGTLKIAGTGTFAVLFFWIASNLSVWLGSGMYPISTEGLIACYVAALPFLGNALAGMAFYGLLLFGGWQVWTSRQSAALVRA